MDATGPVVCADDGVTTRVYVPWNWQPTPVQPGDAQWPWGDAAAPAAPADIIERYWHGMEVAPEMAVLVDQAVESEGGFYAIDHDDLFVMMPKQRRVVFAYGG